MASSSSSFHDIFLSFRGEDTRHSIISHLYAALCRKNIRTFKDNELERGEEISPALLKAIEDSKLSVIIFSKDYASSKWCLDELVKIIECKNTSGQTVAPVFYGVKPSDVRKQSGSFEIAFAKHEEDFKEKNMEKVQRWRVAVTEAAELSGWDSEVTKPESTLVDEIVTFVLKKLNHMSLSEFEGLVGIDSWIERLNSLPCILGLWGIGGIGKTTIAGAFFNRYKSQFEACCFIPNVREQSEKLGLDHLREELLFKILGEKNLHIGTPHIGSTFIKDWLNRKKLLIVFDDVTTLSQLETLVGGSDIRVGSLGSRIIITSRDKQVLKSCEVDHIEEVEGLKIDEALQLFRQYAFKQNRPTKYQLELSKKMVSYVEGNPLALKVLGSSLIGKSGQEWKSKLGALKGTVNKEIEQVLRISYDGLEVEKKDIFLYIACFFKGWHRDYVTKILDGCGFSAEDGISVLIDKALITVSNEYNILRMHDLLQDLGRHIVREESITEPGKRRMLWNHEDICHVLKENTGTETVEGMSLDISKIRDVHLRPEAFARMCNLKLLKFFDRHNYNAGKSKVHLSQGLKSLPNQLRSLCWHGYPLKSLPSKFHPEKLVELDMSYSRVEKLWTGVQPLLVNLKMINLSYSKHLKEMPDLSQAPNLETINLVDCDKIGSLASSIRLESLRLLILCGCSNLKKFPEVSWNITALYLRGTAIEELPPSIDFCRGLKDLDFVNCKRLKNLPNNIFNLKSVETLRLSNCSNITEFPNISGKISWLDLSGTAIEKVPSSIESLSQLQDLDLANCRKLKSLPTSICKLKLLGALKLSGCSKLENFPEILEPMEGLECLHLSRTAIKELPENLGNLKLLKLLDADGVGIKQFPESICCLYSLIRLSLCENTFEKIPASIKQLYCLQYLLLRGCKRLQSLPELPSSLYQLDASNCTSLETVSSNEVDMHTLKELRFSNCIKLNQDARNKIVAAAQLRFQNTRVFPHKSSICYPGSEFPEWFSHQCVGSSLTISSDNKFVRSMVVGANIGFDHEHDNSRLPFDFDCYFKFKDGRGCSTISELFSWEYVGSDDMFMFYNDKFRGNITEVSFEIFSAYGEDKKALRKLKVKKLGVALSYAQR